MRLAAAVLAAALLSGCYTFKQGTALLGYLNKAQPLESLLEKQPDEETRLFVERVRDIRAYAQDELGLLDSKNYTTYVEIDRDYLAAVVSACAADSFTPWEWRFPVIGKVPYKGFFDPEDARKEAGKLRAKGLDVWVRGVDAFSTLGWFKDPLYSYMKAYPVHALADLLIHELLHATVYIKSQSQFNEELAEFVGSKGAEAYIRKTYGPSSPEYRAMAESREDSAAFVRFIQEVGAELEALYSSGKPQGQILPEKEEVIKKAKERFAAGYGERFKTENYRFFIDLEVNNAYFALYQLYYSGGSFLEDLYRRSGEDLPAFIAAARTISGKGDPRSALDDRLLGTR
jgi:predicted aminopeptidase